MSFLYMYFDHSFSYKKGGGGLMFFFWGGKNPKIDLNIGNLVINLETNPFPQRHTLDTRCALHG